MTLTVSTPSPPSTQPPVAPVAAPSPSPAVTHLRQITGRYDGPRDIGDQLRLASALAGADEAVPPMYRGKPGNILALMYQAIALDVSMATALQQFTFNRGKGGMSGALMQALIIRAGHRIEVTAVPSGSNPRAAMVLHRCDDQPGGEAEWTLAEAAVAKLTGKDVWQQYPTDLLWWRCVARLARRFASDVVLGFGYTPEELSSLTVDDLTDQEAAQPERPVDDDVQEFLTDLDALDHAAARRKWTAARKAGLSDRYAGMVDGHEFTVEQLITTVIERLRLAEAAARIAAAVEGEGPPVPDVDAVAAQPAGEGTLPCGCPAAVVVTTGEHLPTCADRVVACDCHPLAVALEGHQPGCAHAAVPDAA